MNVLGIDYGTTRLKEATLNESGKPVIVLNGRGETDLPSAEKEHPIQTGPIHEIRLGRAKMKGDQRLWPR